MPSLRHWRTRKLLKMICTVLELGTSQSHNQPLSALSRQHDTTQRTAHAVQSTVHHFLATHPPTHTHTAHAQMPLNTDSAQQRRRTKDEGRRTKDGRTEGRKDEASSTKHEARSTKHEARSTKDEGRTNERRTKDERCQPTAHSNAATQQRSNAATQQRSNAATQQRSNAAVGWYTSWPPLLEAFLTSFGNCCCVKLSCVVPCWLLHCVSVLAPDAQRWLNPLLNDRAPPCNCVTTHSFMFRQRLQRVLNKVLAAVNCIFALRVLQGQRQGNCKQEITTEKIKSRY